LRCLQSGGSSGTIALANGVVGDIVTSAERGSYVAFASVSSILGPTLSPILGGLLSQYWNWHGIFWFLLAFGGVFFIPLFLFFPETCRNVVGDGSIPAPKLNWNITDNIRHANREKAGLKVDEKKQEELRKNYRLTFPNPLSTLVVLTDLESALILIASGLTLACFYAVSTGASTAFRSVYGFDDMQVALMFIPFGVGGIVSAFTTGKAVDWNYRRHAKINGFPFVKNKQQDMTEFPLEKARLEIALPLFYLGASTVLGYGWVMDKHVSLAGPIILLFVMGYALTAAFQILNIIMLDVYPGRPAVASAANNIVRCELGAATSAAIVPMAKAMGNGWAYTLLAFILLAYSPALLLTMKSGVKWRRAKKQKQEEKDARMMKDPS
ncbi:citrate synthase, partial [Aureobasidium pullulans]